MEIFERIRIVREAEHLGRHKFCLITGINKGSLEQIETGRRPNFAAIELEKVGKNFPNYAVFLMTGEKTEEIKEKIDKKLSKYR